MHISCVCNDNILYQPPFTDVDIDPIIDKTVQCYLVYKGKCLRPVPTFYNWNNEDNILFIFQIIMKMEGRSFDGAFTYFDTTGCEKL